MSFWTTRSRAVHVKWRRGQIVWALDAGWSESHSNTGVVRQFVEWDTITTCASFLVAQWQLCLTSGQWSVLDFVCWCHMTISTTGQFYDLLLFVINHCVLRWKIDGEIWKSTLAGSVRLKSFNTKVNMLLLFFLTLCTALFFLFPAL